MGNLEGTGILSPGEREFMAQEAERQRAEEPERRKETEQKLADAISLLEQFKYDGENVYELPTGTGYKPYAEAARTFESALQQGINEAILRQELTRPAKEIIKAEITMAGDETARRLRKTIGGYQ